MSRAVAGTFLGLDATAWTAIVTAVLVVVTIAYVIVTKGMADSAAASAQDSKDAAVSAKESAEAMKKANELQAEANASAAAAAASAAEAALAAKESVALQAAQINVDFVVIYWAAWTSFTGTVGRLLLTCAGSTVWFHELRSRGGSGLPMPGESYVKPRPLTEEEALRGVACPVPPGWGGSPLKFPLLMHPGESVDLLFPFPPLLPSTDPPPYVTVDALYSLSETGEVRQIKRSAEVNRVIHDPTGSYAAEHLPPDNEAG